MGKSRLAYGQRKVIRSQHELFGYRDCLRTYLERAFHYAERSHSHRGFSPVALLCVGIYNRFNGFMRSELSGTLKTVETVQRFSRKCVDHRAEAPV